MQAPWLSLITITKNDPVGLTRTFVAAKALRSLGVEHLVIDGSVDPLKNFTEVLEGVVVHVRSPNGIADALNFGLSKARGEWVWFINGGDAIHERLDPAWLQTLLANTQADIVTGALHYDGEEFPRPAPPLHLQWPLSTSWLPHPATLIRRRILEGCGGFDQRWQICMDFDLWYRLLGGSARVDVVGMPFARFDVSGISRRPENKGLVLRENTAVLWKYKAVIVRAWWQKCRLVLTVFLQAAKNRWF